MGDVNELAGYQFARRHQPGDWVFASNGARAGKKRGKQPPWLQTIMPCRVQPVMNRLGINK